MSRKYGSVALLLGLLGGVAAYHGGWATVTVENPPDYLIANTPYNMTFSIRAHGRELLQDLNPYVELKSGNRELTARAVATNRKGYYTATLNVPQAGEWSSTVQTSFGKSHLKLLPTTAHPAGARPTVSYTPLERGHRLFVAKGCISCHEHARVAGSGVYKAGINLTDKRFEGSYLRRFLADPTIKPPASEFRMPDLNLSEAEISALVAFINGEAATRTAGSGKTQ